MLVDSSVWIAYLRGDNLIEVDLLVEALEQGAPVWLAPPILQEVLQGADSPDRFARWDRVLGELPMVIAPDQWAEWLDPDNTEPGHLQATLLPAMAGGLTSYPVSTAVNFVRNNGPELIRPLPGEGRRGH